jgi:hypothetical protein
MDQNNLGCSENISACKYLGYISSNNDPRICEEPINCLEEGGNHCKKGKILCPGLGFAKMNEKDDCEYQKDQIC